MILRLSDAELARLRARDTSRPARRDGEKKPPAPRKAAVKLAQDGAPLGRMPRVAYDGPTIATWLQLPPQAKQRARTFMDQRAVLGAFVASKGNQAMFMRLMAGVMSSTTPEATRTFEATAALLIARAMAKAGAEPFRVPVELRVEFRFLGEPGEWPTAHPDGDKDNLEKSLKDAMNRVAVADDRLVSCGVSMKSCGAEEGIFMWMRPARPDFSVWNPGVVDPGPFGIG